MSLEIVEPEQEIQGYYKKLNILKNLLWETKRDTKPSVTLLDAMTTKVLCQYVILKILKMASQVQTAQRLVWFVEAESSTRVQRLFRSKFRNDPPGSNQTYMWHKRFSETKRLWKGKNPGRPTVRKETVERVRATYAAQESQQSGIVENRCPTVFSLEDSPETISHEALHAAYGSGNYWRWRRTKVYILWSISKFRFLSASCWFLAWLTLRPQRWRACFSDMPVDL
jgi:hypothetical protein